MWSTLLHRGLAGSFLRLPHVAADTEALREAGARAAIYGIPFDSTNISRTGANYGPRGMRDVSAQLLTYNATLDFELTETLGPVDCGDCAVIPGDPRRTFEAAQADIGSILAADALPVILGGEHSVTIPAVRAVGEHVADPGLVLIDMHLDTAHDVGGEQLSHCCPVTRAVDAGFDPEKIVLVGISGWMNPRSELEFCREHGITVIWLEQILERGTASVAEQAGAIASSGDGIYLSFDIDSLDAAHAPGTCCPSPGGLSSRDAIELVRGISARGLIGLDVVEVAPSLDPTSATAIMGCRVALEGMAFHAGAGTKLAAVSG